MDQEKYFLMTQSISFHYKNLTRPIEGLDFSGIILGGSASSVKDPSLYKSIFKNVNLSCAILEVDAQESEWDFVDFRKAKLNRCSLDKSKITNCNFQEAVLIIDADDAVFDTCDFAKAKFRTGTYGYEYGGRRTRFYHCDFSGALFKNVEFRASGFIDCNFTDTQFIGCDFRGVKAEGGILPKRAQFEKMEVPQWVIS